MNKTQAAYLAGLIDGEGCIFINRMKKGTNWLQAGLAINMTVFSLPFWASMVTGLGRVNRKKASKPWHRDAWRWTVWSNEAAKVLRAIRPFMLLKGKHADNLIHYQETHDKKCFKVAKRLNKRGK